MSSSKSHKSSTSTLVDDMYELSDEDLSNITELRSRVTEYLSADYDSDFNLFRWLRAYGYDMDEVTKRLIRHLKIRRTLQLDEIAKRTFDSVILKEYVPIGLVGPTGKDTRFVMIECAGKADPEGIMKSISGFEFLMARFQVLNDALLKMNEAEKETGQRSGLVYVYDLDGLAMYSSLLSIVTGPVRILWTLIGDNFPELITKLIVINCPSFVHMMWKALQPFMPEHTKRKVIITDDSWKDVLLKYVEPDHLPVHWGGSLLDAKGDPMCQSRIVIPKQKIPHELYWKPKAGEVALGDLEMANVPAGGRCLLTMSIPSNVCSLHLYMCAHEEFTFQILYADEKEVSTSDPSNKEESQEYFPNVELPGTGIPDHLTIAISKPGRYSIKFGNEKAWLKSINVHYKIDCVDSSGKPVKLILQLSS